MDYAKLFIVFMTGFMSALLHINLLFFTACAYPRIGRSDLWMSAYTEGTTTTAKSPHHPIMIKSPTLTNFGDWGKMSECAPNHYAQGFQLKVESPRGTGDDSSVNGIGFICTNGEIVHSDVGSWGHWTLAKMCTPGSVINGFELKSEPWIHRTDDTATNNLRIYCSDGIMLEGDEITPWGYYTGKQICPETYSVCGIQSQVKDVGPEITRLNQIHVKCCPRTEIKARQRRTLDSHPALWRPSKTPLSIGHSPMILRIKLISPYHINRPMTWVTFILFLLIITATIAVTVYCLCYKRKPARVRTEPSAGLTAPDQLELRVIQN